MKVKIIKGTNQIGGCITEITSNKGTKILIDYGQDLASVEGSIIPPKINWEEYSALFITHIHEDHIGLIEFIPDDAKVDIYVEKVSYEVYKIYKEYVKKEKARKVKTFDLPKDFFAKADPINVDNDIIITPYLVDHSAFNAVMYYVEADGKSVLHFGDFRNNGKKGFLLEPTIKKIGKADLVIMEGTTLSRPTIKNYTEEELCSHIVETCQNYRNILVLQASTNIDRVTTMFNAAKKLKKLFVEDVFTANITKTLKAYGIPNPEFTGKKVHVYVPSNRDYEDEYGIYQKYVLPIKEEEIYTLILKKHIPFMLLVKSSWQEEIDKLEKNHCLENTCLIYSMWHNYREEGSTKDFIDYVEAKGVKIIELHTSGHADYSARDIVLKNLEYKQLLPIHTTEKEKYKKFPKAILVEDGEEVEVI